MEALGDALRRADVGGTVEQERRHRDVLKSISKIGVGHGPGHRARSAGMEVGKDRPELVDDRRGRLLGEQARKPSRGELLAGLDSETGTGHP